MDAAGPGLGVRSAAHAGAGHATPSEPSVGAVVKVYYNCGNQYYTIT